MTLQKKVHENFGRAVAQLEYASVIGSLMYAMHCTRLEDIRITLVNNIGKL